LTFRVLPSPSENMDVGGHMAHKDSRMSYLISMLFPSQKWIAEPFVDIRSSPESLREHFCKFPCSTDLFLGVGQSSLVGDRLVGPLAEPEGQDGKKHSR